MPVSQGGRAKSLHLPAPISHVQLPCPPVSPPPFSPPPFPLPPPQVFAREGLLGGLLSEKYIGAVCPDTLTPDPDLDEVAYCLQLVQHYGGWEKIQQLLLTVKEVADKHSEWHGTPGEASWGGGRDEHCKWHDTPGGARCVWG